MAVPARTIALTGADQLVRTGGAVYRGIVVRETTGTTPAAVRVYDGTSAAGTLIDEIALGVVATVGTSGQTWFDAGGIWCSVGIFVDVVTGTVEGSVRIG